MERISGETSTRDDATVQSNIELTAAGGVGVDYQTSTAGETGQGQGGSGGRMDQARDRAREVAGQAQERLGEVGEQVRERASGMMDQASTRLEDSGALEIVRNNPLPALGIAFGVGFLLAGSSDTGGRMGKAKQNVKGAVLGSLSAAMSQQVRELIESQGGARGLMDTLTGGRGGQGQGQESGASF